MGGRSPRGRGARGDATVRALQDRLRAAVVAPRAPRDAGRLLAALPGLTPAASLEVYRDGWLARLRRILAHDFPATEAALGEEAFTAAVAAYLRAHPPRHPNIAFAGERFPEFLAARRALPHRRLLADLARLEWAVTFLYDAPDGPVLRAADLEGLAPETVAAARFPRASACALLRLGADLDRWRRAARRGRRRPWPPPAAPTAVVVSRPTERVLARTLAPSAARLLEALFAGVPLGEALGRAAAEDGVGPATVTAWFRAWVEAGVFAPPALEPRAAAAPTSRPSPSPRPPRRGASSTRRRARGSAPGRGRSRR